MHTVTFTFRSDVPPERRADLLNHINDWPDVANAAPLKSDAGNDLVRAMSFARLTRDAEPARVVERLRALREVQEASMPAVRRLPRVPRDAGV